MLITQSSCNQMNTLMQLFYAFNAKSDNLVYSLQVMEYNNIVEVFHHGWAHVWPGWGDKVSDHIIDENGVPRRLAVEGYTKDYSNLIEIFQDNYDFALKVREEIRQTISICEFNNDMDSQLFFENMLVDFIPYLKQASSWLVKAQQYKTEPHKLNNVFEENTTFIPILK